MGDWLKTTQGRLSAVATVRAIMGAWWQLGLPRVVFSDELAPRAQYDTRHARQRELTQCRGHR